MGEFHLQHTLSGCRAFAEYFQDQRRAVQNLDSDIAFEIALLNWRQSRVDDDELDVVTLHPLGKFGNLSPAQIGGGFDLAHAKNLGKNHIEIDGAGQTDKLAVTCFSVPLVAD